MTEEKFVLPPAVDGPILVFNFKGDAVLSVGEAVHQADGLPRAFNLSGTPYQTVVFGYQAQYIEEVEDFGYAAVYDAFTKWAEKTIHDEDFYSIEWRTPPTVGAPMEFHVPATIVDAETGEHRQGLELRWAVQLRCRLAVHKSSHRPPACVENATSGFEPMNWLTTPRPVAVAA